jgi:hypothetical protein
MSARCFSCSGVRSSTRVASAQRCPEGSISTPYLSPQNVSSTGMDSLAPAPIAVANAASTSSTYIMSVAGVPPSVSGDLRPSSTFSSSIIRMLSPMQIWACMVLPSAPASANSFSAPNTFT